MTVDVQFNVDQALAKLGDLVAKHGPDAVNLAAQTVQISAIESLTGIVGWGIMSGACLYAAHRCMKRAEDHSEEWVIGGIIGSVAALGFLIPTLCSLFSVWSWVALFNPKLALAHQVLAKFAGL